MIETNVSSLKDADGKISLAEKSGKPYTALLSIGKPVNEEHCLLRTGNDLLVDFWDTTPTSIKRRMGLPPVAVIASVIEWGLTLPKDSKVLVHCKQGRSRSTACAIILNMLGGIPVDYAVRYVYDTRFNATPNWYVLAVADQLLGTNILGCIRSNGLPLKSSRREHKHYQIPVSK